MFKHWMEIVRNLDNGYRDWLFYWNSFPQRTSIMSGSGKGSTSEGLVRSPFTEL